MNGKLNAIGLALLMIASALAGCTSGDPDGDGEMGIDTEMLDELIQDNLQDFINNTTVTVNNVENNYINSSSESTTLLYTITGSETGDETVDFDAFNVGTEYTLEITQESGEKLTFLGLYYMIGRRTRSGTRMHCVDISLRAATVRGRISRIRNIAEE